MVVVVFLHLPRIVGVVVVVVALSSVYSTPHHIAFTIGNFPLWMKISFIPEHILQHFSFIVVYMRVCVCECCCSCCCSITKSVTINGRWCRWWDELLMLVWAQVLRDASNTIHYNALSFISFSVYSPACMIIIVMIMVKHASYQAHELHLRRTWNVQESKWFIILLTKSFYYFFSAVRELLCLRMQIEGTFAWDVQFFCALRVCVCVFRKKIFFSSMECVVLTYSHILHTLWFNN